MTQRKRVIAQRQAAMLLALTKGACTYQHLMQISGLSERPIADWLKELRSARLVHVCGWGTDVTGYPTVAQFAWGPGRANVTRPSFSRRKAGGDHV